MANYTKVFMDAYPNGWKAKPDKSTPYHVSIKDNEDETFRHIEDYLYNNPIGDISSASIKDLSDVDSTNPTNGQTLIWNSTSQKYVPGSVPMSIKDLSDVDSSTPTDGQSLIWNNTSQKYVPGDVPMSLTSLSDVNFDTSGIGFLDNYVVKYDALTGKFVRYQIPNLPSIYSQSPQKGEILVYGRKTVNGTEQSGYFNETRGNGNNVPGGGRITGATGEILLGVTGLDISSSDNYYRDKVYSCTMIVRNPTMNTLTSIDTDLPDYYVGGDRGDVKYYLTCDAYLFFVDNFMNGFWVPIGAKFDANDCFGVMINQSVIKYYISGFSSVGNIDAMKLILSYNKTS